MNEDNKFTQTNKILDDNLKTMQAAKAVGLSIEEYGHKTLDEIPKILSDNLKTTQGTKSVGLGIAHTVGTLETKSKDHMQINKRNGLFSLFVENFVNNSKDRLTQTKRLKLVIFWIIVVVFIITTFSGMFFIGYISIKKVDMQIGDLVALISAFGVVLSSLIILPKIIVEHLFPKDEHDKSIELFSKVLDSDLEMRMFYKREDELDDDMAIND